MKKALIALLTLGAFSTIPNLALRLGRSQMMRDQIFVNGLFSTIPNLALRLGFFKGRRSCKKLLLMVFNYSEFSPSVGRHPQ
jgi:hypothetical protein